MGAIPSHSTGTDSTSGWDAGKQVGNLGDDPTEAQLRAMHAWVDPDADPSTKGAYKFPHHMANNGRVGAANIRACSAAVAALNGARGGSSIPGGDRRGVWAHVAKHMRDSGIKEEDVPELKGASRQLPVGMASFIAPTDPLVVAMSASLRALGSRWGVVQDGERWRVVAASGTVVWTSDEYAGALEAVREQMADAGDEPTGTLPERWRSEMAYEGVSTGDGRYINEGAIEFRDCPLPLMLQTETEIGHFGAVLAGAVEQTAMDGTTAMGAGSFDDSEAGKQFLSTIQARGRFGVSIDVAESEGDFVCTEKNADGDCVDGEVQFSKIRIMGLTGTPFPAFEHAFIEVDGDGTGVGAAASTVPADMAQPANDSDGNCKLCGGSGKIRAGSTKCPDCNGKGAVAASAATEPCEDCLDEVGAAAPGPLLAAAFTSPYLERPPAAWFSDPGFCEGDGRTVRQPDGQLLCPLTVTPEGEVFGHFAGWETCHTGYAASCVRPPRSKSGYAAFLLRPLETAEGEIVHVGHVSMGCGHIPDDGTVPIDVVRAHYDGGPGAVQVARVACGEDAYGGWFHGALAEGLTDDQVRKFAQLSVSGHWREVWRGKGLDLLGCVAGVTVPGFPVTSMAAAASLAALGPFTGADVLPQPTAHFVDGRPVVLVAAGAVRQPQPWERMIASLAAEVDALRTRLAVVEMTAQPLRPLAATALRESLTVQHFGG